MDAVSLYQAGFPNTAGVLGTALTLEHVRLVKRINAEGVILLLDNDPAGEKAALRAIPLLLDGGLRVKVLQVPDAKDPDEYIQKFGPQAFGMRLAEAQSHMQFRLGLLRREFPGFETEQRTAYTQAAAELLATLSSEIETDIYVQELAAQTKISPQRIDAEINKARAASGGGRLPGRLPNRLPGQASGNETGEGMRVLGYRRNFNRTNDTGLQSAFKNLIQLLFASAAACRALEGSKKLTPGEMGDDFYAAFLHLAYETARTGYSLVPADAVSRFETLEEQKRAADVFSKSAVYESESAMEKALNDIIFKIKSDWLIRQMDRAKSGDETDMNAVNTLLEARLNLPKLYITLTDG
jgi:DNA primase